jgi:hypothetical protein
MGRIPYISGSLRSFFLGQTAVALHPRARVADVRPPQSLNVIKIGEDTEDIHVLGTFTNLYGLFGRIFLGMFAKCPVVN